MGHPKDPAAISCLLQRHAFAQATKAIEFVVGQQLHVVRQGLVASSAWGVEMEHKGSSQMGH
jgi:hypothetical protein